MATQITRRSFLGQSLATGIALPVLANSLGATAPVKPVKPLKILILGGTGFIGPHQVRNALARGHEVTLFNRGKTNTHLFPDVEKLKGDRDKDLSALKGRKWDVVLDNSCYLPRWAKASAELLADSVEHYAFISTISVYPESALIKPETSIDEDTAVDKMEDETNEEIGRYYGALKALCEQAVEKAMPGRVVNVRPGYIVGPGDPTDRFTYWPMRVDRGGEVLVPDAKQMHFQVIDVRDLAEWCMHLLEQRTTGTYNAVGYKGKVSFQEFLHGCKVVSGADCSFTWVPEEFLTQNKLRPGALPIWNPGGGMAYCMNQRAMDKGLTFRSLGDTIKDTIAWAKARGADYVMKRPLSAEDEKELLAKWHGREK